MRNGLIFLILTVTLASCVTYRVNVTGTITVKHEEITHPAWYGVEPFEEYPVDVSNWIVMDSGGVITIMPGGSLNLEHDDDVIHVIGAETDTPSNLNAVKAVWNCPHFNKSTFVIGSETTCRCLSCGTTWPGPCN